MKAYRLLEWGRPPELTEVPQPRPGPGEVLVKVAAAGLCHTDLHFGAAPPGAFPYPAPFTLGHEVAGWVSDTGPAVDAIERGLPVVALAHSWCGTCKNCVSGNENYCPHHDSGLGFGEDGGLAEYVVVPRHSLVPLNDLDPRTAGQLACAGITAYHAVKRLVGKLVPGSTCVVIGPGGIGAMAVQCLRAMTSARIVAVDVSPTRLAYALELGADLALLADDTLDAELAAATSGLGAEAVLDFVGTQSTVDTALRAAAALGSVAIVGGGGGIAKVSWGTVPRECEIYIPQNGTLTDLREVVALAGSGRIRLDSELFGFDQLETAYDALRRGALRGRAMVVMP
ncbi:MAG: Alcohol dehydrogenase GroES domain protein [Frankiales bacterium]|nr:Alcohol dehydrogenase GroES domain protein [Frankiales bacterium]